MSYEFYKLLHLVCLVLVVSCLGISYFCKPPLKWARLLGMTASFLLMVAGMGLLVKAYGGQPWPLWVQVKLGIWLVLAVAGPMMAKRLTKNRGYAYSFLMCLFVGAIYLAVFRPF